MRLAWSCARCGTGSPILIGPTARRAAHLTHVHIGHDQEQDSLGVEVAYLRTGYHMLHEDPVAGSRSHVRPPSICISQLCLASGVVKKDIKLKRINVVPPPPGIAETAGAPPAKKPRRETREPRPEQPKPVT